MIIVRRLWVYDAAGVLLEEHVARTMRGLFGWRAAARSVYGASARLRTQVSYVGAAS
jgi:hypothetical protein